MSDFRTPIESIGLQPSEGSGRFLLTIIVFTNESIKFASSGPRVSAPDQSDAAVADELVLGMESVKPRTLATEVHATGDDSPPSAC